MIFIDMVHDGIFYAWLCWFETKMNVIYRIITQQRDGGIQ